MPNTPQTYDDPYYKLFSFPNGTIKCHRTASVRVLYEGKVANKEIKKYCPFYNEKTLLSFQSRWHFEAECKRKNETEKKNGNKQVLRFCFLLWLFSIERPYSFKETKVRAIIAKRILYFRSASPILTDVRWLQ